MKSYVIYNLRFLHGHIWTPLVCQQYLTLMIPIMDNCLLKQPVAHKLDNNKKGRADIYSASNWKSCNTLSFRALMRTAPDRLKHPLGFNEPCPYQA